MPRLVEITLSDTVEAGSAYNADGNPVIVGTGPIWKDDSDATYAQFAGQYFGGGNPQFVGNANSAVVGVQPYQIVGGEKVIVRFRVDVVGTGSVKLPFVRLEQTSNIKLVAEPTALAPRSPGWVELELVENSPGQLGYLLNQPTSFRLYFSAPTYKVELGESVPNETQRFNIYEAHVYISVPSNEAPPCRMWPRDDGLGVGAGRNYPPPKSQQRSSRGVGYY